MYKKDINIMYIIYMYINITIISLSTHRLICTREDSIAR